MKPIPTIVGHNGNFVVVSEIASVECLGADYEFTLKSGVKVLLCDQKGDRDAAISEQLGEYFGEV